MSHKRIPLECTAVVGVDIGSERHLGYIRGPDRLEFRAFPFTNDRSGFHQLARRISEAQVARGVERVVLALEPTGPYGEALAGPASERFEVARHAADPRGPKGPGDG